MTVLVDIRDVLGSIVCVGFSDGRRDAVESPVLDAEHDKRAEALSAGEEDEDTVS